MAEQRRVGKRKAMREAWKVCDGRCTSVEAHWRRLSDYGRSHYLNGGKGPIPPPEDIDELMRKNFGAVPID